MSRKYNFNISVTARVKTTILAEDVDEAWNVLKQLDWIVKLDAMGPYDQVVEFEQAGFDEPQIVFTKSEIKEGESTWYCNNFCELDGDNLLYTWLDKLSALLVSKYGIVQNETVDGEKVEEAVRTHTQEALDNLLISPYCKQCHRKAKQSIY